MFRIFVRYLGRQILLSTFFAVAVLSVVLVLGQIFKKLLDKLVEGTLPPEAILRFIGYSFPWSLSFTVPWGILTAVLLAGGGFKHGQHLAFDRDRNYPLPNLFVNILQRMGIEADHFSTSTGTLRGLEPV